MSNVKTRFAPSPTGRMHVGNLRTALYAYLITKHEGGDFILRIEDTDQERYVEGAVDIIYRTLEKTGLLHDEGLGTKARISAAQLALMCSLNGWACSRVMQNSWSRAVTLTTASAARKNWKA